MNTLVVRRFFFTCSINFTNAINYGEIIYGKLINTTFFVIIYVFKYIKTSNY